MSEIKVNSIKGVGASAAAITVNNTDGTCTANLTNRTNRNLIINGAMLVAQRGTSSTASSGYNTVDRIKQSHGGADEAPTYAQVDVASGTTPYTLGFRKAFRVTNGNQTSGAAASDYIQIDYFPEAQDLANSGWNYTSASSYVTVSFWIKSSVAQAFPFTFRTQDGTSQVYNTSTGSLSANTWTKVTKTIPGNSNIQIDNDNDKGARLMFFPYIGTTYTTNGLTLDTWSAWADAKHSFEMATTWWTTNDATFEVTGFQLEVGSVATDFEHRSFGDELTRCQRYFYMHAYGTGVNGLPDSTAVANAQRYTNTSWFGIVYFPVQMRAKPSLYKSLGTDALRLYNPDGSQDFNDIAFQDDGINASIINFYDSLNSGQPAGWVQMNGTTFYLAFSAEL